MTSLLLVLWMFVQPAGAVPVPVIPPGTAQVAGTSWTGDAVDTYLIKWGVCKLATASFIDSAGATVYEVVPTRTVNFVRFYAPNAPAPYPSSNAVGNWVMSAHDVRGLTAAQVANLYALPAVPTNIVQVRIPAGSQYGLWTGIAGPIAQQSDYLGGDGGGQQTRIIGKQTASGDPANFANYSYLPSLLYGGATESYINGQVIGGTVLSYQRLPMTGNAAKMAAYLDRFNPDDDTDLADVYTALDYANYGSDPSLLITALRQISPEKYDAISAMGLRNSLLFANGILERSRIKPAAADPEVWAQGVGELGSQTELSNRVGFDYHTEGFMGGVEGRPGPGFLLGLAAAGLQTRLDWANDGGYAVLNTVQLGLYGGWFSQNLFLNAAVAGGHNETNAQRNITFTGNGYSASTGYTNQDVVDLTINRTAISQQDGESFAAHIAGGAQGKFAGWDISPLARLSYFNLWQNAFDEGHAGDINLHVNSFGAQTLRGEIRLLAGKDYAAGKTLRVKPELGVGWAHNVALDNRDISASLISQGGDPVVINGYNAQSDSLLMGAGLNVACTRDFTLSIRYDLELSDGFNAQTAQLGLRYGF